MFNKLFSREYTIHRHLNAPLLKERLKYLNYWSNNGAVQRNLFGIAEHLLVIIHYLDLKNKKIITITKIKNAAKKWASRPGKKSKGTHAYRRSAEAHFIWHATQWLRMIGYLEYPVKKIKPFSDHLLRYINYMRQEKGLSEETIKTRIYQLEDFFNCFFENKKYSLQKLNAIEIDKILIKKCKKYSRRTIQHYASTIRAFLTYAEQCKWISKKLANTIKTPRTHKYETIPSGPSWDNVKKLLPSTENKFSTRIRNRAIIMLLVIYGLRRSEIVKLRLDDIDWKNEMICLRRAKNKKTQKFPLLKSVGESILRYLRNARPNQSLIREIFISSNAPHRPLQAGSIFSIVNRRWEKLNVNIKHRGPHALRHACATHLINKGISLKEISDYLGHQNLNTTLIYAKVDLLNLRKVADFNIGDIL